MEAMTRSTWTDERMDDLSRHVDEGFECVDRQFERVDNRLDRIEDRLAKAEETSARQFERLDSKFDQFADRIDARIDSFQLAIIRVGGGLIATMALGFAGLLIG
ncbi:MAG TPA: hypothetical protein VFI03_08990 [Solirubrobacterales bacterium]|nr:hypothetical protein [Solirubrobacterales bacterium]